MTDSSSIETTHKDVFEIDREVGRQQKLTKPVSDTWVEKFL